MAVAALWASPQVTLRDTLTPAGTDTATARTAPTCKVSEVTPPSKVPCGDGVLPGAKVDVVVAGSVVVVVDVVEVVVDVVVDDVGGIVVTVGGGVTVGLGGVGIRSTSFDMGGVAPP